MSPRYYESIKEAKEANLNPVPWKEAREGDWAVSDDGYVVFCRKCKVYKGVPFLTFSVGRRFAKPSTRLLVAPHLATGYTHGVGPDQTWEGVESGKTRTRIAVDKFVSYVLASKKPDLRTIGRLYRPDCAKPVQLARKLFRIPRVKKMVEESLRQSLSELGLDERWVLEQLKDATEIAAKNSNTRDMITAAVQVGRYLGMGEKKRNPHLGSFEEADFSLIEEQQSEFLPPDKPRLES